MKLLLFLHLPDPNVSNQKIKAMELRKIEQKLLSELFATFKQQIKSNSNIKIIEEIPDEFDPQVIIECADDYKEEAYQYFRDIDTVKTVDSYLPNKNSKADIKTDKQNDKTDKDSNPPTGKKILTLDDLKKMSK